MAKTADPECPKNRRGACESEWAELKSDVRHMKDDVGALLTLVRGNGGVGMRIELDRCTQTQGRQRVWIYSLGAAAIGGLWGLVRTLLTKGAGP